MFGGSIARAAINCSDFRRRFVADDDEPSGDGASNTGARSDSSSDLAASRMLRKLSVKRRLWFLEGSTPSGSSHFLVGDSPGEDGENLPSLSADNDELVLTASRLDDDCPRQRLSVASHFYRCDAYCLWCVRQEKNADGFEARAF